MFTFLGVEFGVVFGVVSPLEEFGFCVVGVWGSCFITTLFGCTEKKNKSVICQHFVMIHVASTNDLVHLPKSDWPGLILSLKSCFLAWSAIGERNLSPIVDTGDCNPAKKAITVEML